MPHAPCPAASPSTPSDGLYELLQVTLVINFDVPVERDLQVSLICCGIGAQQHVGQLANCIGCLLMMAHWPGRCDALHKPRAGPEVLHSACRGNLLHLLEPSQQRAVFADAGI